MIYQLQLYLETELPAETFYPNTKDILTTNDQVEDRIVLLREMLPTETAWFQFQERMIQITSRDIDVFKARKLAYDIHEKINNKFGLILPTITISGNVFPELVTAQISANALPQPMGYDDNGRALFVANYRFLLEKQ
jgi:hypothetical protein